MICKLRVLGNNYYCHIILLLYGKARKTLKNTLCFSVFNAWTNKCRKHVYLFSWANSFHNAYIKRGCQDFPGGEWWRILLPMQGTWVRSLVQEDSTCHGAAKPVHHNYWACTLEPMSHNYWSLQATTTENHMPRARALQQEKPPQWEACAPQQREAPAHRN